MMNVQVDGAPFYILFLLLVTAYVSLCLKAMCFCKYEFI